MEQFGRELRKIYRRNFHDGRPANVFKITKYTYTNDGVRIDTVGRTAVISLLPLARLYADDRWYQLLWGILNRLQEEPLEVGRSALLLV
jgi:hypothetical protein